MPSKRNPSNLNPLQLKTLTLLQALAAIDGHVMRRAEDGSVLVGGIPAPHGDHFHLGDAVVASRDATGLGNQAAWTALERKGFLVSHFPQAATLTPQGLAYETGLAGTILHRHSGH
jgi:hypothetical protein